VALGRAADLENDDVDAIMRDMQGAHAKTETERFCKVPVWVGVAGP
jgi:hypothetical protein